jgi:type I restriction enzyme M protein
MRNDLGQFYTQDNISNLLVSKISTKNPKNVIELGFGSGSLVRAAKFRWKNSQIIGCDIDPDNVKNLKSEFPNTNAFLINGLSSKLSSDLKVGIGTIDVGICNPPYLKIKKTKEVGKIIENANLGKLNEYNIVTSDLVFLAQNLRLIKENGELAIILPDGLITSHQFLNFRKNLLNNYHLRGIIELPEKVFEKTEAKTHILIIKKVKKSNYETKIYKSDNNGNIVDSFSIKKQSLIYRMDYNYFKWKNNKSTEGTTLRNLGVKINRGSFSHKALKSMNNDYLHTSDLKNNLNYGSFKSNLRLVKKYRCAEEGDLIIARVGKRCLQKALIVKKGAILFSDCLYVLKIPVEHRNRVFKAFNSDYGKNWINAHAHGVCAKVISKSDLLDFVIP